MSTFALPTAVAEALLTNSPAGIAVYAGDTGECLLANEMMAEIVGESVEAMLIQNFRTLASWREAGLDEVAESTLCDGLPRHREVTVQSTFGKTISIDCSISRLDIEGRPHLMLIAFDVTERRQTEQALTVREQELRTLIETIPDLIVRYDRDLCRTYVNPAWEQASGLSAGDVINVPAAAIPKVPNPTHDKYMQKIQQVLETGTPQKIGFTWVNAFGTELYLEYVIVPEHDRSGEITGVLAVGRDLSERRRAEEALNRLNRELRAISDCNQVLVRAEDEQSLLDEVCRIVCDEAGYRMAWVGRVGNDRAKSVWPVAWAGVEDDYLAHAGLTWADTERGRGPAGAAIRSGSTDCSQDIATDPRMAPWRDSALQRGYRSAIALPLKDENENVFGVFLIYSSEPNAFTPDEIRLMEELAGDLAFGICALHNRNARKESERSIALLSFALDNVHEAAFMIDEQARFNYVNEESCRVLGYGRDELLALGVADVDPDFPIERWPAHWAELKNRCSLTLEGRHKTKDGRIFSVEISANYLEYDGQGYNLALVRDITERKKIEDSLRFIAQRGWLGHTGDFLTALATHLGKTFVVDYVIIDRLAADEPGFAETVALYAKGALLPSMRYPLSNTPCENVMGKVLCYYPRGVQALFPADLLLAEMGVESYAGVPLWDSAGCALGLIAVMDSKPFREGTSLTNILQLVATSAAAALERQLAEEELRALNDKLEQRVKERTAELAAKNAELERMNKAFVGRELKMIELKERIKKLEHATSG